MQKGWICNDCDDGISNIMGLGDIPDEHKSHNCGYEATGMAKCDKCERLSGGYRDGTMCYNPECEGRFRVL